MVADLVGSAALDAATCIRLTQCYHTYAAKICKSYDKCLEITTAGDGLDVIFDDPVSAGNCALELRNWIESHDWKSANIHPAPHIRIALHTGIVEEHWNPAMKSKNYTGPTHNIAARLEPVAPPMEVITSRSYAAVCATMNSNLYCSPIGFRSFKKTVAGLLGTKLYRLNWKHRMTHSIEFRNIISDACMQEVDWIMLQQELQKQKVVPVIGPELLTVRYRDERNGTEKIGNFYTFAMEKLTQQLAVSPQGETEPLKIFDLCCKQKEQERVFTLFKKIIDDLTEQCEPPEALVDLVRLQCFPGYIVTTPDKLLAKALKQANLHDPEWQEDWEVMDPEYEFRVDKTKDYCDVNLDFGYTAKYPFIYHIFGKINANPDAYAFTENAMLMFARKWNETSPTSLKKFLYNEADTRQDKTILMLGCNYENWYARLFLFNLGASSGETRLHNKGIIADSQSVKDSAFGTFLANDKFGKIYYDGNVFKFISKLRIPGAAITPDDGTPLAPAGKILILQSAGMEMEGDLFKKYLTEKNCETAILRISPEKYNEMRLRACLNNQDIILVLPLISSNTNFHKEEKVIDFCKKETEARNDRPNFVLPVAVTDGETPDENVIKNWNSNGKFICWGSGKTISDTDWKTLCNAAAGK